MDTLVIDGKNQYMKLEGDKQSANHLYDFDNLLAEAKELFDGTSKLVPAMGFAEKYDTSSTGYPKVIKEYVKKKYPTLSAKEQKARAQELTRLYTFYNIRYPDSAKRDKDIFAPVKTATGKVNLSAGEKTRALMEKFIKESVEWSSSGYDLGKYANSKPAPSSSTLVVVDAFKHFEGNGANLVEYHVKGGAAGIKLYHVDEKSNKNRDRLGLIVGQFDPATAYGRNVLARLEIGTIRLPNEAALRSELAKLPDLVNPGAVKTPKAAKALVPGTKVTKSSPLVKYARAFTQFRVALVENLNDPKYASDRPKIKAILDKIQLGLEIDSAEQNTLAVFVDKGRSAYTPGKDYTAKFLEAAKEYVKENKEFTVKKLLADPALGRKYKRADDLTKFVYAYNKIDLFGALRTASPALNGYALQLSRETERWNRVSLDSYIATHQVKAGLAGYDPKKFKISPATKNLLKGLAPKLRAGKKLDPSEIAKVSKALNDDMTFDVKIGFKGSGYANIDDYVTKVAHLYLEYLSGSAAVAAAGPTPASKPTSPAAATSAGGLSMRSSTDRSEAIFSRTVGDGEQTAPDGSVWTNGPGHRKAYADRFKKDIMAGNINFPMIIGKGSRFQGKALTADERFVMRWMMNWSFPQGINQRDFRHPANQLRVEGLEEFRYLFDGSYDAQTASELLYEALERLSVDPNTSKSDLKRMSGLFMKASAKDWKDPVNSTKFGMLIERDPSSLNSKVILSKLTSLLVVTKDKKADLLTAIKSDPFVAKLMPLLSKIGLSAAEVDAVVAKRKVKKYFPKDPKKPDGEKVAKDVDEYYIDSKKMTALANKIDAGIAGIVANYNKQDLAGKNAERSKAIYKDLAAAGLLKRSFYLKPMFDPAQLQDFFKLMAAFNDQYVDDFDNRNMGDARAIIVYGATTKKTIAAQKQKAAKQISSRVGRIARTHGFTP